MLAFEKTKEKIHHKCKKLFYFSGCQFYPPGEYLRFVRVPENLKVGDEVLKIDVFPRNNLVLQPVDKVSDLNAEFDPIFGRSVILLQFQDEDVNYFTYRDVNRTTVSLLLAASLEDLVDTDYPRNVLKLKVSCDYDDGEDIVSVTKRFTRKLSVR